MGYTFYMSKKLDTIEISLKKAIQTSGISPYKLARLSGVADAVISRFLNGKRDITLTTAAKLAEALGLELRMKKDR